MKRWIFRAALILTLAFISNQNLLAQTERATTSGTTTMPGSNIPDEIAVQVLTIAAPHFSQLPPAFIGMYRTCGCILLESLGQNIFRVTYGGVGIQIVIDATSTIQDSGNRKLNESLR